MGQGIQTGAKGAADSFNRFVEGDDMRPDGGARGAAEPERKDFWDSFGKDDEALSANKTKPSSIGTAAMKKGGGGHGGSGGKEEGDGWGDW
jgi:ADP-ribosylation factor GTPase-activating protein 1